MAVMNIGMGLGNWNIESASTSMKASPISLIKIYENENQENQRKTRTRIKSGSEKFTVMIIVCESEWDERDDKGRERVCRRRWKDRRESFDSGEFVVGL